MVLEWEAIIRSIVACLLTRSSPFDPDTALRSPDTWCSVADPKVVFVTLLEEITRNLRSALELGCSLERPSTHSPGDRNKPHPSANEISSHLIKHEKPPAPELGNSWQLADDSVALVVLRVMMLWSWCPFSFFLQCLSTQAVLHPWHTFLFVASLVYRLRLPD